ncbi:hypothetical protein PU02_0464 [Bartonella ancashensis]|uniref:Uncharacterized protein n=2 Tax=Bartonella ancashensis TaxID=1318743 RepID=A0A0M5KSG1_9HYPH|nr:hypothetical protein PU02_0464 [Bartonella ancashensis]
MTLTMSNPRLEGYTSSQQPYWLKAEKAFQNRTHFELVKLQNIIAEVPAGKQGSIFIKAKIASYDGTNGFLQFDEPFTIKTKDGLIAQFVNANVNLLEKNLRTDKPVNIRRPGLFMTANSLQIREGGQIMHFQNGVHLIFNR